MKIFNNPIKNFKLTQRKRKVDPLFYLACDITHAKQGYRILSLFDCASFTMAAQNCSERNFGLDNSIYLLHLLWHFKLFITGIKKE